MAKKGKMKISKLKRNNHTTSKMKKAGQLKLQRHRPKVQKQKAPQQPQFEYSSESESESGDEFADMLDDDEQQYLMSQLSKNPQLLSAVPEKDEGETKQSKKRKRSREGKPKPEATLDSGAESEGGSESELEDKYVKDLAERPAKKLRPLLPIKTKEGLMERAEEVDDTASEASEDNEPQDETEPETLQFEDSDSGMEATAEEDTEEKEGEEVTTVQLLAARRDTLNREKLRIGALCSSLLESPEKKMKNLYPILYLMEEKVKDGTPNLISARKLATLSAYEVFKDILPEYQIRHQDYANIKLKKDTLALYKHEKELLEFYKRYLQRLEKATAALRPKKGNTSKADDATLSLALISVRCMCGLLRARPHFNYALNIAQSVVPLLGSKQAEARAAVAECCSGVFEDDRRGEITLTIVRLINQLVKKRGDRLHPSALDCLLSLNIKDVELDAEEDVKNKQKQEEKHKKRIVNLSKKEKKRSKKLKEVERELLETQAQESALTRKKHLTEVTRVVFHIYFRLLKTAPKSPLLAAALAGITKFTHVINLEYYTELVTILIRLMSEDTLTTRSRVRCVHAALRVLSGAGDALTVDPARLHAQLYGDMIGVHAGSTQEDSKVVLSAVSEVASRARRVSPAVLQALAKRLATLAMQLGHNGALAALALLNTLVQQSKPVSTLLETTEETIGSGRFDPYLPSPEHCNAHAARIHELNALRRHFHPTVRAAAASLVAGSGVPKEIVKLSPEQIFEQYDGSQMAFKPAVPPPNKKPSSGKRHPAHVWTQTDFKKTCEDVESSVKDCADFASVYSKR